MRNENVTSEDVLPKELAYKFFKLSLGGRLALFVSFVLIGIAIQFFFIFPGHMVLGFLIIGLSGMLMIGASYTKTPKDLGFEEWKPVTMKEFDRLLNNYAEIKKARIPLVLKKKPARAVFFVLALVMIFIFMFIYFSTERGGILVVGVDILLILYPLFLSGNILIHAPKDMEMKLDRFRAVIEDLSGTEDTRVTPYFRFDKDSAGKLIPEDVRLMVEPKRKPADLIGAQLQVSINKGPNGPVPYMYAVILAQEGGSSISRMKKMQWSLKYEGRSRGRTMISEPGGAEGFGYIVVRQPTESGGYETNRAQCTELARLVLHGMKQLEH